MKLKTPAQKCSHRSILSFSRQDISNFELPFLLDRHKQIQKTDRTPVFTKEVHEKPTVISSKQLDHELSQILLQFKGEEVLELLTNIFEIQFYQSSPQLTAKSIQKAMSLIKTARSKALRVVYLIFSVKRPVPIEVITEELLMTLVKLTRSPTINLTSFSFDIEEVSCDSKLIFIIFSRIFMMFRSEKMFYKVVEFLNKEFSIEAINEYLAFFLFVLRKDPQTLPNEKLFFSLLANRAIHYSNEKYMYCIVNIWKQLLNQAGEYTLATSRFILNSIKSIRSLLVDQTYSSHFSTLYDLLIQMLKTYKQEAAILMMKEIYPILLKRNKVEKSVGLQLVLSLIQNYVEGESYLKYRVEQQINVLNYQITFNMANPRGVAKVLKTIQEMCKAEDGWVFEGTNFRHILEILSKSDDYLVKQAAIQTLKKYYPEKQDNQ